MSCDEIRGAVDIGDGLCRITEGSYEGYVVNGEDREGHHVGEIISGPNGKTSSAYVGGALTNCESAAAIVMPASVSSEEFSEIASAYPGRTGLGNGEGTQAVGETCFYMSQPTREREFINRLWDPSTRSATPYCTQLFSDSPTERCRTLVTTLCDGFSETHPGAAAPEACGHIEPEASGVDSASDTLADMAAGIFSLGGLGMAVVAFTLGPRLAAFATLESLLVNYGIINGTAAAETAGFTTMTWSAAGTTAGVSTATTATSTTTGTAVAGTTLSGGAATSWGGILSGALSFSFISFKGVPLLSTDGVSFAAQPTI